MAMGRACASVSLIVLVASSSAPHAQATLAAGPDDTSCDAVVAHYASSSSAGRAFLDGVHALLPTRCQMIVYDKSSMPCSDMPSYVSSCTALENVGREQHTYARHVATSYNALPAWLIFTTSDLSRHHRAQKLHAMLNQTVQQVLPQSARARGAGFACSSVTQEPKSQLQASSRCRLNAYAGCTIPYYPGINVLPATPARLMPWLREHLNNQINTLLCGLPTCHYGIAVSTRENLRAHPSAVYDGIVSSLSNVPRNQPIEQLHEAGFYLEWAMAAVFGSLSSSDAPQCDGTEVRCDRASCEGL